VRRVDLGVWLLPPLAWLDEGIHSRLPRSAPPCHAPLRPRAAPAVQPPSDSQRPRALLQRLRPACFSDPIKPVFVSDGKDLVFITVV
jgi:hypothetical protein